MPLVGAGRRLELRDLEGLDLEAGGRGQAFDGDAVAAEQSDHVGIGGRNEIGVGAADRLLRDEIGEVGKDVV